MKEIILHGELGRKFGGPYRWNVDSASDAISALCVQMKGFRQQLCRRDYQIIIGDLENGMALEGQHLTLKVPENYPIHIMPVLEGGKSSTGKGIGKIVVGVAMLALVVFSGGALAAPLAAAAAAIGTTTASLVSSIALMGISMILAGVSTLLAPKAKSPKASTTESPEERASFIFNSGTVNTTEQGNPIQLLYGRFLAGSQVISAGITNDQIGSQQ